MSNERMNTFFDAVVAIIMTIMVLELKVPHEPTWSALLDMKFDLLTYLITFITIAIYWNNHHHMFQVTHQVTGGVLWSSMALLFCLSLFPFTTSWMAEFPNDRMPELLYGLNVFVVNASFFILVICVRKTMTILERLKDTRWAWKTLFSQVTLILGISLTLSVQVNYLVLIAVILSLIPWIIPDKRLKVG